MKKRRKGALSLDLFLKIKDLSIVDEKVDEDTATDDLKHCVNVYMIEREGVTIDGVSKRDNFHKGGGNFNQRGRGRGRGAG